MAVLLLPMTCHGPTGSPITLKAIRSESRQLMRGPNFTWTKGADDQRLPAVIARLRPNMVLVTDDGVEIFTPNFFDGGWGYFVPRSAHPSSADLFRHQKVAAGVYWFYPY